MTVDRLPPPRSGAGRPTALPAPGTAFPGPAWSATVAPPWQRVPGPRPRGAITLVARDGRPVGRPAGRPDPPAVPGVHRPPVLRARPPVVGEPEILGLSRLTRGRVGSRVFTLFFVAVFALIAVQMLLELVHG